MRKPSTQLYLPVLLAIAVAVGLTYYWLQKNRTVPSPTSSTGPTVVEPQADETGAPVHPFPPVDSPAGPAGDLVPLPALDQSDAYFRLALADVFSSQMLAKMLAETDLIVRIVATVDSLPRDRVAERIRPIAGVEGSFNIEAGSDNEFTISTESYKRYDLLVDLVAGADLQALTEIYSRFYPLFQTAYVNLGYPNAYFNDRLVEVIDHLLDTPDIQDPIRLVRPHVLYEYADTELESLSSGQKLMIRMGSKNATRIKTVLKDLRMLVANQNAET